MSAQICCIGFDIDDTLYERSQPFLKACADIFAPKKGMEGLDWEEVFKVRNFYSEVCFEDSQTGRITMEEMYHFRLSKALQQFGKDCTVEEALAFEARYSYYQHHIEINPGMAKILDELKASGFPICLVTNGPSDRQRVKITALQLEKWVPEQLWCISGDLDTMKPYPEIFDIARRMVEKYTGCNAGDGGECFTPSDRENCNVGCNVGDGGECFIYVGDNYTNDVECPHRAGWKTVWYCKSVEEERARAAAAPAAGADTNQDTCIEAKQSTPAPAAGLAADFVVHNPEELHQVLAGLGIL